MLAESYPQSHIQFSEGLVFYFSMCSDKFPPVVESCPANVKLHTIGSRLAVGNWTEPQFSDNVDVVNITSNFRNG